MTHYFVVISLFLCVFCNGVRAFGEYVLLKNDGPVVQGAEITFTANVFTSSGHEANGHYEFSWEDNGIPYHSRNVKSDNSQDKWTLRYPAEHYPPGPYTMQVEVYTCFVFCFPLTSNRIHFNITAKLNGQINAIQNNFVRPSQFVSNASIVQHSIALTPPDYRYLMENSSSLLTYWFIDCQYYGMTSDLNFSLWYRQPETQHVVEALIVASFIANNNNNTNDTVDNDTVSNKTKRDLNIYSANGSIITLNDEEKNATAPLVCLNQTNIAPDPLKAYGYFAKSIVVKVPVDNITVNGNNWLQHGEMLSLDIKCTGSASFKYCVNFLPGIHNATQNETCTYVPEEKDVCDFNIARYYKSPGEYTILIIVKNDVSKLVYPIGINVYKVTKRPQVSVIVVPVSFSLVAVVLIVFGMAYYVQNQRRFTVEVANFDFGQSYTDMEYKTFGERLRESLTSALTRTPHADQSETPPPSANWPTTSSRKYGSMT